MSLISKEFSYTTQGAIMLFSEEKLFIILSLRDVEYESNRASGPTEPQCCFFGLHFNRLIFPKETRFHSGKT